MGKSGLELAYSISRPHSLRLHAQPQGRSGSVPVTRVIANTRPDLLLLSLAVRGPLIPLHLALSSRPCPLPDSASGRRPVLTRRARSFALHSLLLSAAASDPQIAALPLSLRHEPQP